MRRWTHLWRGAIGWNHFARMLGRPQDGHTQSQLARSEIMGQSETPTDQRQTLQKTTSSHIQACLETGPLFDAATRSWQKNQIESMQSWIDRAYRYV